MAYSSTSARRSTRETWSALGSDGGRRPSVSCYLKIFYSRNVNTAKRMLVEELASYDQIPSYHRMFELAGVAEEIARAKSALGSSVDVLLDGKLLEISPANPTMEQLAAYVSQFREAGVDLPCLYPYFESNEDESFKMSKVEKLVEL